VSRRRKNGSNGDIMYDSICFSVDQASGEVMSHKAEDEPDILEEMRAILESTNSNGTSLVTLLQKVQRRFGYLPREAMIEVARAKEVSPAAVFGVASFYNQFRMIPPGKYPVKMCMGTACHIKGGNAILKVWETKLGISEGEVTEDRLYSLDRVACVGCCAMAPVAVVGEEVHGNMMPTNVDGIMLAVELAEKRGREQEEEGSENQEEAAQ
jgi:NADH-quinone oxidoreductase subunit E